MIVCDADPGVVSAINERGLEITGPVEAFTVRVPAINPADLPKSWHYPVLVAVKAHHTGTAAARLRAARLDGDAFVVSLQNGLNAEATDGRRRARPRVGEIIAAASPISAPMEPRPA